jgi:deoxyinosine 3'endonuclease (endonuclease V)
MNIILDVRYEGGRAAVAGVEFEHWSDRQPHDLTTATVPTPSEYFPGKLYKRELPCLLTLLRGKRTLFKTIIIDGYVHLQPPFEKGLGAYLADALPYPAAIVGVAKTAFKRADRFVPVYRGCSRKPLYVSSWGLPLREAARQVERMDGKFRLPTLIKLADQLSRGML